MLSIGIALGGAELAIGLFAGGSALVYIIFGLILLRLAGVRLRKSIGIFLSELAFAALVTVALVLIVWQIESEYLAIAIGIAAGCLTLIRILPAVRQLAQRG